MAESRHRYVTEFFDLLYCLLGQVDLVESAVLLLVITASENEKIVFVLDHTMVESFRRLTACQIYLFHIVLGNSIDVEVFKAVVFPILVTPIKINISISDGTFATRSCTY